MPEKQPSEYPNYSIKKLVESLCKSIENDKVNYALMYLCAYDKDAKQEVIEELDERKKNKEPFLTETEKQNVLKDIQYYIDNMEKVDIKSIDKDNYELKFPDGSTTFVQEKDKHWLWMPWIYKLMKVSK